jgi:hypothetical protein
MVIGGQAVLLYGEPRLTKDIGIVKKGKKRCQAPFFTFPEI